MGYAWQVGLVRTAQLRKDKVTARLERTSLVQIPTRDVARWSASSSRLTLNAQMECTVPAQAQMGHHTHHVNLPVANTTNIQNAK